MSEGVVPKLAFTIEEASFSAAIGTTVLYDEINAGRLIAHKRGRSTLILAADLSAYLAALPVVETKQ